MDSVGSIMNTKLPHIHSSVKKRRSQAEIQQDIDRYNALVRSNPDLEYDIPPRKGEPKARVAEQENRMTKVRPRRTRVRAQPSDVKPDVRRRRGRSSKKSQSVLKRPMFDPELSDLQIPKKESTSQVKPRPLSIQEPYTYESHVSLTSNYTDLIEVIMRNWDSIDVSLHHNLLPKNIEVETKALEIDSSFYEGNPHEIMGGEMISRDLDSFLFNLGSQGGLRDIPLV